MNVSNYQRVTDRIVAMLEAGTRPWSQSWTAHPGGGRPLRHDGQKYRGANTVNLWAAGLQRGFSSPYWLTYKKAAELGAQVKKGAKSELAFYVGAMQKERDSGEEYTVAFLKSYSVFNAEEVEGLAAHYYRPMERPLLDLGARIPHADAWMAQTGATIVHGGGRAYYRPSTDAIQLPEFGAFESAAAYYGVAAHELVHWTGHESRLDRGKGNLFGSPDYAFEELVAELGAAYVSADLGIAADPREDHAAYIASWLKCLRADNRAIFRAASFAEKAATFLAATHANEDTALAA